MGLPADLAAAIARAGVDPTPEPDGPSGSRALQDALRRAITGRGGYGAWDIDHVGWVVGLLVTCPRLGPPDGNDGSRWRRLARLREEVPWWF